MAVPGVCQRNVQLEDCHVITEQNVIWKEVRGGSRWCKSFDHKCCPQGCLLSWYANEWAYVTVYYCIHVCLRHPHLATLAVCLWIRTGFACQPMDPWTVPSLVAPSGESAGVGSGPQGMPEGLWKPVTGAKFRATKELAKFNIVQHLFPWSSGKPLIFWDSFRNASESALPVASCFSKHLQLQSAGWKNSKMYAEIKHWHALKYLKWPIDHSISFLFGWSLVWEPTHYSPAASMASGPPSSTNGSHIWKSSSQAEHTPSTTRSLWCMAHKKWKNARISVFICIYSI